MSAGPDQRRTESSDATGHVRGSYTFIDDKGVQHTVHYIAGPETGYRVLKNVKAPHFPSWYPLEPSRPSRPSIPSLPPSSNRPGYTPPDFGGEDYGDGDKNIEDIFGGPQEQLSTAASGHAKPSKPPAFGASSEKDDKQPPFDNDFGGSFDDTVGGRPSSTSRPSFSPSSTRPPFSGGGQKPFLDDDAGFGRPSTTRRPFGQGPSKPSFLDDEDESGFGGRPGSTRPPFNGGGGPAKPFLDDELQGDFFPKPSGKPKPFGGDEDSSGGFGTTGGAPGGQPSSSSDDDFMDDLFKPSGPTGGGISKPSKDDGQKRPGQDFGFDGGRPSSTRPPYSEDVPKPFDDGSGGSSSGDDFELFGGDKGPKGQGSGRPSYGGNSKEDMNYGLFDGSKGPTARPPQRPGSKDDGSFDFFGDKGPGSSTPRPSGSRPFGRPNKDESFDFFDDEKRPPKRPSGDKDFDFFGGSSDKGSTQRPFRPTPGGNKNDDDYSFDRQPATSRPPFASSSSGNRDEGQISGSINVATTYDGKITILTNIGDKHISFPPGVAVRAHVQSIDFLPYGSRIPSPSEQLKSDSSDLQHVKRDTRNRYKDND